MVSEAQLRAIAKYDKKNTVQFHIKLNKKTDADIVTMLKNAPNKQNLIRTALRLLTAEQINDIIKEG